MSHVRESIQAFVSGELDADRQQAVVAHLAVCPQCRSQAKEARSLWELLGAVEETSPAGPSIWPQVRSRTMDLDKGARDWFFGRGPWMRTGLATMAVAAGLCGGILIPGAESNGDSDSVGEESAWLVDSSWLSGTSWLSGDGGQGLDGFILGTESVEMENGS
jgi:anti-sigma factor RsiW